MTHSGHEAESMKNNNWDGWLQISSTLAVLFGIALEVWQRAEREDGSVLAYPFGRAYWAVA